MVFLSEENMYKIQTSSNHVFRWRAPLPVLGGTTPTLEVTRETTTIAGIPALAKVVADQTIISISADRRRITSSGALLFADAAYAQGEKWGHAWVISQDDNFIPVMVQTIDISDTGNVLTLADPLPRKINAVGAVQWSTWYTEFTSADVTASASKKVQYSVTWQTPIAGEAAGDYVSTTEVEFGRIYVVDRLFDTGLDTLTLHDWIPEVSQKVHGRTNSHASQIDFALAHLYQDLKCAFHEKGVTEDDADGEQFAVAHAYLTASLIFDGSDQAKADFHYGRYERYLKKALDVVWLDLDGDGDIDENDTNMGSVTPATATQRRFPDSYYKITNIRPYDNVSCGCTGVY